MKKSVQRATLNMEKIVPPPQKKNQKKEIRKKERENKGGKKLGSSFPCICILLLLVKIRMIK